MLSILLCIITIFFSKQLYVTALTYLENPYPFYFSTKKNTFGQCEQAINHHYPVKCLEDNIRSSVLGEYNAKDPGVFNGTTAIFFYIYTDPLNVVIREFTYDDTKEIYTVSVKVTTSRVAIGWESWFHTWFWIGIYDTNGIIKQDDVVTYFDIIIGAHRYNTFEIDTEVKNFSTSMNCLCKAGTIWNCKRTFEKLVKMGLKECLKNSSKCSKAVDLYANDLYYSIHNYLQAIVRNRHQIIIANKEPYTAFWSIGSSNISVVSIN